MTIGNITFGHTSNNEQSNREIARLRLELTLLEAEKALLVAEMDDAKRKYQTALRMVADLWPRRKQNDKHAKLLRPGELPKAL